MGFRRVTISMVPEVNDQEVRIIVNVVEAPRISLAYGAGLEGGRQLIVQESPDEVVARVMAILRRVAAHPPNAGDATGTLRHGRLTLDTDGWRAIWDDTEIALTVTEFGILRTLAAMPSKIFSRDAIIDRLHGPGFAVTDRTIDSHVRNLRAKFAAVGAPDVIETRAGVGYRIGACAGA